MKLWQNLIAKSEDVQLILTEYTKLIYPLQYWDEKFIYTRKGAEIWHNNIHNNYDVDDLIEEVGQIVINDLSLTQLIEYLPPLADMSIDDIENTIYEVLKEDLGTLDDIKE